MFGLMILLIVFYLCIRTFQFSFTHEQFQLKREEFFFYEICICGQGEHICFTQFLLFFFPPKNVHIFRFNDENEYFWK